MTLTNDMMALWTWPLRWLDVGRTLAETATGAGNVVSERLPVIAAAMRDPLTADRAELALMYTEKAEAFTASATAARSAERTVRRAADANARAIGKVAAGGVIWPDEWMRLTRTNLAATAAMARLPQAALAPVHRTVRRNRARLAGVTPA